MYEQVKLVWIEHSPDRDDGRKQDQEPYDINIPQTTEAIESYEDERQNKCNRAQNLQGAECKRKIDQALLPATLYLRKSVDFKIQ